ncbi:adhesion G protein-coupled receptor L2-like isoform X2 [Tachypleus tridentatus]|uniref:adhesion G protein-coupled receptor L2-like isoform X2 n=1 Tax=Tachypleus tridentatus TaxID=6853 RepID=UPI003FD4E571
MYWFPRKVQNIFAISITLLYISTVRSQGSLFCALSGKDLKCYSVFTQVTSWNDAVNTCREYNKQLLCTRSIESAQVMINISKIYPTNNRIWILNKECAGEPKECLSFILGPEGGEYLVSCKEPAPFICQDKESNASTFSEIFTKPPVFCKAITSKNLHWPREESGKCTEQSCPDPTKGTARWCCDEQSGQRTTKYPDFSHCKTVEISQIWEEFKNENVEESLDEINSVLEKTGINLEGDLLTVVDILNKTKALFEEQTKNLTSIDKKITAISVTDKVIEISSDLLDMGNAWNNTSNKTLAATKFLTTVEKAGYILTPFLTTSESKSIVKDNIALQVLRRPRGHFQHKNLILGKVTLSQKYRTQVTLPSGFEEYLERTNETNVVFVEYNKNVKQILIVEKNFRTNLNITNRTALNSPIVSVSLKETPGQILIPTGVKLLLEHDQVDAESPQCTFWNSDEGGYWDDRGCHVSHTNKTHTLCVCDHLTSFAVLMDIQKRVQADSHRALKIISVICCTISIICLGLCIITFTCIRSLWGLRNTIHLNLCICLMIGELLLVFGIDKTQNMVMCSVIAGFMHYFFLASFVWMMLEGVYIYLLIVIIFETQRSYKIRYYLVGYGIPLIILGITAAFKPQGYRTANNCWLSPESGVIWSFAGPAAFILLTNFVIFIIAFRKITKNGKTNKDSKADKIRKWIRGSFAITPLLGLTWIVGFLQVGKGALVASYIFTMLNSLQGLAIFVILCLVNGNTRKHLKKEIKRRTSSASNPYFSTEKSKNVSSHNIHKPKNQVPHGVPGNHTTYDPANRSENASEPAETTPLEKRGFSMELPITNPDISETGDPLSETT